MAQLGLYAYGFDCWVEVDPYDRFDEAFAALVQAIDCVADLGLGLVISHDPWARVNAGRRLGECPEANVRLFGKAAAHAAQAGLQLVLEPHPDTLSIDPAWACDLIDNDLYNYPLLEGGARRNAEAMRDLEIEL